VKPPRVRFTVRGLMVVVAIVGAALAWFRRFPNPFTTFVAVVLIAAPLWAFPLAFLLPRKFAMASGLLVSLVVPIGFVLALCDDNLSVAFLCVVVWYVAFPYCFAAALLYLVPPTTPTAALHRLPVGSRGSEPGAKPGL
jgi:hypothetical protein